MDWPISPCGFCACKCNTSFSDSINFYAISGGCTLKCHPSNHYALPRFRVNGYFFEHLTLSARKTIRTYWPNHYWPVIIIGRRVCVNIYAIYIATYKNDVCDIHNFPTNCMYIHWKKKFVKSTNLVVAGCHSHMLLSEHYT